MPTVLGQTHAPQSRAATAVVAPGEFVFSVCAMDHGHIYGMTQALIEAGATLKYAYDRDPQQLARFLAAFPDATPAAALNQVLDDRDTRLVASAAIPAERCPLGLQVLHNGKHYFTDKCPMTTLDQLAQARKATAETGLSYMTYYSERLHVEAAILAGQLVQSGAIGRVVQVLGTGPHRLAASTRPAWFFNKAQYGGILTDIGSHQIEQILHYTGATDAEILSANVNNYANPSHPELEDFGDCALRLNNGASGYFRVDWLTPSGLRTWGDGRTLILGTEGYIELRKYIDVAQDPMGGNWLILVNAEGEQKIDATGATGFPFFGALILDILEGTARAMTQEQAFKPIELALKAQSQADQSRQPTPETPPKTNP